tara:strand:- start:686 stop:913 length:228 start_codon:yes stop_codon:yes gene_type:complete
MANFGYCVYLNWISVVLEEEKVRRDWDLNPEILSETGLAILRSTRLCHLSIIGKEDIFFINVIKRFKSRKLSYRV